jgi:hypothetical protein
MSSFAIIREVRILSKDRAAAYQFAGNHRHSRPALNHLDGFLASPLLGNGSWFSRSNVWDNFLIIRSTREHDAFHEPILRHSPRLD